jgi:uncharacterized protein
MTGYKDHHKKLLLDIIAKHLPDCKVYLYGSRARKDHQSGSDFDLALDNGSKIDLFTLSIIKEDIEESCLPVFVDVIDIHHVSADFLNEIKKDWVAWKN